MPNKMLTKCISSFLKEQCPLVDKKKNWDLKLTLSIKEFNWTYKQNVKCITLFWLI